MVESPTESTQPGQPEPSVFQKKPEGPASPDGGQGRLKALALIEVGLFELLFVAGGLIIIFGILNYYNVLPISQSLPFLSFFPQQEKIAENKIQVKPQALSPAEIDMKVQKTFPFAGCPVKPAICKDAEIISDTEATQSSYWNLGYSKLSADTPILAVLDGNVEIDKIKKNGENHAVLTLTSKSRLLKAYYEFEEGSFKEMFASGKTASQGAILGTILNEGAKITERGNDYSFIFSLESTVTKNYAQVKPSSDGKNLLYAGH